jgi:BirA family transcriptional regulator, biotin operon repressor / biotin---[acetyl-CoA-carboxylase] ligase
MPHFDLERLRDGLAAFRLHHVPTCRSTNDLAARMRREGRLFAPAVVVTSRQTRGRGRGGNRWSSDVGTLTFTLALPVDAGVPPEQMPIRAGLAVRDAAAGLLGGVGVDVQLKWPNDVLVEGAKLAGLLCERLDAVDLIGVGLNVETKLSRLPPAVRNRATSLRTLGASASLTETAIAVADRVRTTTAPGTPFAEILSRYHRHHCLVGRTVRVRTGADETVTGECRGLDATGRLVLVGAGGTTALISGVVESY